MKGGDPFETGAQFPPHDAPAGRRTEAEPTELPHAHSQAASQKRIRRGGDHGLDLP